MSFFNRYAALAANIGLVLAQTSVTVNVGTTFQQIDGFGVSQAFGRANEFRLSAATPRQKGLDYLFSTTTGAGLTIIRNRIGSGGAGDSILPNSPGSPGGSPQYQWDGVDAGQVWFSQQAMNYGVRTIYADAWSAPGFMKTNGNQNNGGWLCGVTGKSCSSGDWRQAYANFLVQYVKYYNQAGIPITHLGFLNEPDWVTSYSSMQSDAAQAASFIPTLYNTLASNGLSSVKVTCCDALGWPSARTFTTGLVSAGMERYMGVMSTHMYSGDPKSPPLSTSLKVWQTEGCDLDSAWCTTWYSNGGLCEGLTWANKLHMAMVDANLSAYIYWQGFEVNEFQSSSYLVASDGTNVTPSGRLWAFAMWSRHVRPGAYRVATSGTVSGVGIGAFKNSDGTVVVIFTNTSGSAQSVRLSFTGFTPSSASGWVMDNRNAINTTTASLSGGAVTVSVPARAVVTVKMSGGGTSPTSSSAPRSSSSTPRQSSSTSSSGCSVAIWGQCGGQDYTGCTRCVGSTCTFQNQWYSQCL